MEILQCPLDPSTFLQKTFARPMGLAHLKAIEEHVSAGSNCPHPLIKELQFGDGLLKGSNPLILACHFGELDSVKHMVDIWNVDVQAAGTYYPDPKFFNKKPPKNRIEAASPLFVASFQNHSKIVSYLLEEGADVSARTENPRSARYDGLSPLYGAFVLYYGRHARSSKEQHAERAAIARTLLDFGADVNADSFRPSDGRPIWAMPSCGEEAAVALINRGIDLNQRDSNGGTMLRRWCDFRRSHSSDEEDSLPVVKLLLEKGAKLLAPDNYGVTPFLFAAYNHGFMSTTLTTLDLILEMMERDDTIETMEKIHAFELVGAVIISNSYLNASYIPKGLEYWRRALRLRLQMEPESSDHPPSTVIWKTTEELERVIQHPAEYLTQSVLIQLKILSASTGSWKFVREAIGSSDKKYIFESSEQLEKLFGLQRIYWAMLDTILSFDPTQEDLWDDAVEVMCCLVETLVSFAKISLELPTYGMMEKSLRLIVASDEIRLASGFLPHHRYKMMIRLLFELFFMNRPRVNGIVTRYPDHVYGSFISLTRQLDPELLGSILLVVCGRNLKYLHNFSIARLLLASGADLDVVEYDIDGNCDGPLHLIARSDRGDSEAIGCLLVGYGAKLNRTNKAGMSALDIWTERNSDESGLRRHLPDWCLAVPKLQCLAARAARANGAPYSKLPVSLRFFVDKH